MGWLKPGGSHAGVRGQPGGPERTVGGVQEMSENCGISICVVTDSFSYHLQRKTQRHEAGSSD